MLKTGLHKLNGGSGRRRHAGPSPASLRIGPGPTRPPVPLDIRKDTQKSVSPLTDPQVEKIMFFVNPEMPSKTFVMVLKILPDPFNNINVFLYRI